MRRVDIGSSRGGEPGKESRVRCEDMILYSLRQIIHAVEVYSRKLATTFKLTTPQLVCLLMVKENEPITPSRIARNIHLNASTVVGILDRLEASGLVRRERDARDRRLVYVSTTQKGLELAERAPSPLHDELVEALKELPELEQMAIAMSLERIVELMGVKPMDIEVLPGTGAMAPAPERVPAGAAERLE